MNITVELAENDIKMAIVAFLKDKGYAPTGRVTLSYDPGDRPSDAPSFSAEAGAEDKAPGASQR